MKIIIITIFALFLFSCLDGQDGLFGTNGKIGCVEKSDCEVGYLCNEGKCEKTSETKCTIDKDCKALQRCNKQLSVCEWSFGNQCETPANCGNSIGAKVFQCADVAEQNEIKLCFFENCSGVSDAVEYIEFNFCFPRCTDDFLCEQIFGVGKRVCKVSEGICILN